MEQLRSFPETRRQFLGIMLPALVGVVLLGAGMAQAAYGKGAGSSSADVQLQAVVLDPFGVRFIVLLAGLAAVMGFLAFSLPRLLELPHEGIARVCLLVVAAGALAAASLGTAEDLALVAALSVLLVFLAEMFRPGPRENLLRQVSGTYTAALITMMGSLWMLMARTQGGGYLGLLCAGGIGGALIVSILFLGTARLIGVPLGALAGAAIAQYFLPDMGWRPCLFLAVCLGLVMWGLDGLGRMVGMRDGGVARAGFGLIPVSAIGVVGYALALLVL
ncbi:hypothetical protein [Ancrocorticia populi]|uniref:hypothetical protein n=1 Tax=Ancrocorticia populi TaxID=2175228 RepID=UPI003F9EB84B